MNGDRQGELVQVAKPIAWRRAMVARDPHETHRQATFLELFFDLCFVVAVAQVAASFHQALAEDHAAQGIVGFITVFFAIWWAWMNFTWLASAYDNDDVPYRIGAFLQIVGALIVAAGVKQAFAASLAVTIPVGLFLAVLWMVQGRPGGHQADKVSFPTAIVLILISSHRQESILWTGVILCALVAFSVSRRGRLA